MWYKAKEAVRERYWSVLQMHTLEVLAFRFMHAAT